MFVFSGCVTSKVYSTGKVIYKGAKVIYIELPVQSNALEDIDNVLISYDRVRTKVKKSINLNKKKVVVNTTQTKK